jgi:hypothetical protein
MVSNAERLWLLVEKILLGRFSEKTFRVRRDTDVRNGLQYVFVFWVRCYLSHHVKPNVQFICSLNRQPDILEQTTFHLVTMFSYLPSSEHKLNISFS